MSDRATRRITYDPFGEAPKPGDFMVSMTRKGVGSIYHIASVRLVKSKYPGRVALDVYRAEDMRRWLEARAEGVFVRGEKAFELYWYSRSKTPE
jgi:hypothetical protein